MILWALLLLQFSPAYTPLRHPHPAIDGQVTPEPPPAPVPPPPVPVPVNQPPVLILSVPVTITKQTTIIVAASDDVALIGLELSINGKVVKSGINAVAVSSSEFILPLTDTMTYKWNTNPYRGSTVIIKATARDAVTSTSVQINVFVKR